MEYRYCKCSRVERISNLLENSLDILGKSYQLKFLLMHVNCLNTTNNQKWKTGYSVLLFVSNPVTDLHFNAEKRSQELVTYSTVKKYLALVPISCIILTTCWIEADWLCGFIISICTI